MIRNYVKIALRNLTRNRAFSFINIFGLAVGLATCLLIMFYIFEEKGFDRQFKDADRIYRIAARSDKAESWAAAPAPLAQLIKSQMPEIEASTRLLTFTDISKMLVKYESGNEKKQFFETSGYYVDSNFFEILNYPLIVGDPRTVLSEPNTMVISKSMAEKFLGRADTRNQTFQVTTPYGEFAYKVTGVFDDTKVKSHIHASYFLSMRNKDMWNWVSQQSNLIGNSVFYTYIKLNDGVDPLKFEAKLDKFYDDKAGAQMKSFGVSGHLFIQPLKSIYLTSNLPNELSPNGNIFYLYILGSIAAFILVIACINFMNLSTARAEKRAREVGVRKVMGAERSSIIRQFLGESMLHSILALALALLLVNLALPLFNRLAGTEIGLFEEPGRMTWIAGLTLLTGLIAGIYPAFYLSSFRPVAVLKGKIVNTFSGLAIRKGLVIFQFTISVCLILGALVIWKQLNFLNRQTLGFDKTQKVIIPLQQAFLNTPTNYYALKTELEKEPQIKAVTGASSYPGLSNLNDMLFYADGRPKSEVVDVQMAAIADNYIQSMGFTMLSGRAFSSAYKNDSANIILNETAVRKFGFTTESAIGKKIRFDLNSFHGSMEVVGVVKDFNFESLHHDIKPFGFITNIFGNPYGYLVASISAPELPAVLAKMQKTWTRLNPGVPFAYSFLDKDFQRLYENDQRVSRILTSFMVIAIMIACLGLFGLAAFSAEQRKKEIGIRKVLGASVNQVTILLSKDFLRLVTVGVIIATPISWWAMNKWLQEFAYRTPVSWWMFAIAGFVAIIVALATVSFQAIRAALANPVSSLRSE